MGVGEVILFKKIETYQSVIKEFTSYLYSEQDLPDIRMDLKLLAPDLVWNVYKTCYAGLCSGGTKENLMTYVEQMVSVMRNDL